MFTIGFLFWLVYVVSAIIYFATRRDSYLAPDLIWWVLLAILGIGTFGNPFKF